MQNQDQDYPNLIIKGTFVAAKPAQQKGNYTIREFAVDDSYFNAQTGMHVEQVYALQMFGDKCASLDNFKKGDKVIVRFNLRAGKDATTGKWRWINVSPWKIEIDPAGQKQPVQQAVNASAPVPEAEVVGDDDDLPF